MILKHTIYIQSIKKSHLPIYISNIAVHRIDPCAERQLTNVFRSVGLLVAKHLGQIGQLIQFTVRETVWRDERQMCEMDACAAFAENQMLKKGHRCAAAADNHQTMIDLHLPGGARGRRLHVQREARLTAVVAQHVLGRILFGSQFAQVVLHTDPWPHRNHLGKHCVDDEAFAVLNYAKNENIKLCANGATHLTC